MKQLCLLIVALSFALTLHALAGDSFWGDEILTASFASRAPAEVIRWTAEDIHPPLYYLLAGGFTRLTLPLGSGQAPGPVSDWLWRFPSAIAVVLTVALTYRLAAALSSSYDTLRPLRQAPQASLGTTQDAASIHSTTLRQAQDAGVIAEQGGYSIPLFAALLLCLAPVSLRYGQEARMHALFMCFSALSTWLLLQALRRPQAWGRWLAFSLVTAANLYTMYFGFLILAAQGGFLVAQVVTNLHVAKSKECGLQSALLRFKHFSLAVTGAFLLYLPWWPVLFSLLRKRAAVGAIEGGVGSSLTFAGGVVKALGPLPLPVAWGFLALFGLGLLFLAWRKPPMAVLGGLWLALPVLLPIFLGDPRALQFRYAFVLPVYLAVVAYAVVSLGVKASTPLSAGSGDASGCGRLNRPAASPGPIVTYMIWVLGTLSFIASLRIYPLVKPDWRGAAAYLDEHTRPADIILTGPLWDEGRFIDYYYQGEAQLLTPAAMVTNIERRAEGLRASGGRIWAVNRFAPAETAASRNIVFPGVVISEPKVVVYEPELLTGAAIDLAAQAVEAAYPWAAAAEAQGILNPDPRTAKAAALRALGDTFMAAHRPAEALEPYQTAVTIFPGWTNGFIALGEAYEATGDLPAAAEAYRQAVRFNLEWQGVEANQAAALIEAHDWPAALEIYRTIINH